jgi:hypothetical protein
MSSKRYNTCKYGYDQSPSFEVGQNCCCNFKMLVILILIILQFGKKGYHDEDHKECESHQIIDNSILFIIALFYLSCCIRCK